MKRLVETCLILGVLTGCSPTAEDPVPTCSAVCANVEARCGIAAPGCPSACASFSDALRRCTADAASCAAAEACAAEPEPDAPAPRTDTGSPSDGGAVPTDAGSDAFDPSPCGTCTATQYCVTRGSSTLGCWSPPADCTAACDSCLDAALFGPDGPCPSGTAPGCEASAATGRIIDCI